MKNKVIILFLLLCLLPSIALAGTAYYVDCSSSSNGNGTFENPLNDIRSVNNFKFSTGDDVYFKVNTTCDIDSNDNYLKIDWNGSNNDWVIIGAYYGNGKFGLNGNDRPIFDGDFTYPSTDYTGIIDKQNGSITNGYVRIQDIKIKESRWHGIIFQRVNHFAVSNCYTSQTRARGIIAARSSYGEITDNIIERASYNNYPGAGVVITAMDTAGQADNILVARNTMFHCFEGFGLYKKPRYVTLEDNVIYDNRRNGIYLDAAKYCVVRHNLVYFSRDTGNWEGPSPGIWIQNESERGYCHTGNHEIYGNLVAYATNGIQISCQQSNCGQTGLKIYNNTIVDSERYNFKFYGVDENWSNNFIKNNISWTISGGKHADNYSPIGVVWDTNNFDDPVSGNASRNALIHDPELNKTSGWRTIEPGTARKEWFISNNSTNIMYSTGALTGYVGQQSAVASGEPPSPSKLRIVE
jgi:parallel beta-helix repeat protein